NSRKKLHQEKTKTRHNQRGSGTFSIVSNIEENRKKRPWEYLLLHPSVVHIPLHCVPGQGQPGDRREESG
ncbi:hypothetical protein CROQUDRAFT_666428, partial [Cronartium quercuum f. sp. fusiforme G11]